MGKADERGLRASWACASGRCPRRSRTKCGGWTTIASLAIWGGNNEIEVAFGWFPDSRDPDKARLYAADYNQVPPLPISLNSLV